MGDNLKMKSALLSRFDLVFILVDKPNVNHDKNISEHILRLHRQVNGNSGGGGGEKRNYDQFNNSGSGSGSGGNGGLLC